METLEVQRLANQVNSPVIKLSFRRFADVLIQGDSLYLLYQRARELQQMCKLSQPEAARTSDEDTAFDLATEFVTLLAGYLGNYVVAHKENGLKLPFHEDLLAELEVITDEGS